MKLFISADIEGTAGIADWGETSPGNSLYDNYFVKQMTKEVSSACKGALESPPGGSGRRDSRGRVPPR